MAGHQEHVALAVTTLDGVQLEGIWLANGGALYVPNFCEAVGLDRDVLVSHTDNNELFIPRSARSAMYRGELLYPFKLYIDEFPGNQYPVIMETNHNQAWLQHLGFRV